MNIKIIGENDAYFSAEVEWNLLVSNSLYTRKMKAKVLPKRIPLALAKGVLLANFPS